MRFSRGSSFLVALVLSCASVTSGPQSYGQTPASADVLVGRLDDADPAVRLNAARDLGALGPAAAPAVAALTTRLSDAEPQMRAYAAYALGMIGPAAAPTFPKIAELVVDADPQVRREAVKALRRLKIDRAQMLPVMIRVLESSSSDEVIPAMHAIAEGGKEAVPALIAALAHEEARYWACQILGNIGADASAAVPAVTAVLNDPRAEVRREAVLCLGHIGAAAKSSAPVVLGLTSDADSGTRAAAIWAAVMIGATADEARPKFAALAADADPLVQVVAAWAIAKLDATDATARGTAVTKAVAALKSQHAPVRGAAARALVDLKVTGDQDPEAVEALVHALADNDEAVTPIVLHSLVEAGEAAVPKLIKGLERPELRGFACMVLTQLGTKGKAAKDALLPLLTDPDAHTRAASVAALCAVAADDAGFTVLAGIAALEDPSGEVRFAAADALGRLGAAAKSAEPALLKHAADPDPLVREAVAQALKAISQ